MSVQTLTSVEQLVAQLERANAAYRSGEAIMSDAEYDALEDQLRALNPTHPFLTALADHVVTEREGEYGREEELTIPMGSQQKALTVPEMESFYRATAAVTEPYQVSLKLDGMSCELTYRDGKLTRALTRGDGKIGVNITRVVLLNPDVPKTIPHDGVVVIRGEVMMRQSGLEEINRRLTARGLKPYSNVRNGTVGVVNTLKNLFLADCLTFMAYNIIEL